MDFERDYSKGVATVRLIGDLDATSAREAREYIDQFTDQCRPERLTIDFAKVGFMDSTGIGVLLGRYKRLKALDIDFCVTNLNAQIDKIFRVSGLYQIIKAVTI